MHRSGDNHISKGLHLQNSYSASKVLLFIMSLSFWSCKIPGWMKHKLESALPGEISINLDMQMAPPLWQKMRGTEEPLDESEKAGLKLNTQKTKFMASGPITSWQIDGETNSERLFFLGSKITVDSDCSHKIKRHLLLGRKAITNLNSIFSLLFIYFSNKIFVFLFKICTIFKT